MISRYIKYFDLFSFILVSILSCIGLMFVFSATYTSNQPYSIFFKKQLFGIISGFFIYIIFFLIDYRKLSKLGYFAYLGVMILLVFTLLIGSIGGLGGRRWISLGIIKFQPSELAKLFFPAYFVENLERLDNSPNYTVEQFLPIFCMLIFSFLLIAKQPDLGTALIVFLSGLGLLWFSGMSKKFFIFLFIVSFICVSIFWKVLKPYQKQRVSVFFGAGEMKKERYQIEQAKIAIGSGGFLGQGFLQGTQNKLNSLSESRTDCIFAVVCEEFGFLGAFILLIIYNLLFMRLLYMIFQIQSFFAQIFAMGLLIQ